METSYSSVRRLFNINRSAFMVGQLPTEQQTALWHYLTNDSYKFILDGGLTLKSFGCSASRFSENETAYPHRSAAILIQFHVHWRKSENELESRQWLSNFYTSLYGAEGPTPDGVMDGSYANYPDGQLKNWSSLYFKGNYERLKKVKKYWDSLNIFNHRQSIT